MKAFLTEWLLRHGTGWVDATTLTWDPNIGFLERQRYVCRGCLQYAMGDTYVNARYKLTTKALKLIGETADESVPD